VEVGEFKNIIKILRILYRNIERQVMSHRYKAAKVARLKNALQSLRTKLRKCKTQLEEERQAASGRRWLDQNSTHVEILNPPPKKGSEDV